MSRYTLSYLPEPSAEVVDPTLGLPELRKGLNTILMGYLLWLGAVLAACAVVVHLILQAKGQPLSREAAEHASTLLFGVVVLLGLAGLGSMILLVQGKWLCLSSAPERFQAKWMMFLSIDNICPVFQLRILQCIVTAAVKQKRGGENY